MSARGRVYIFHTQRTKAYRQLIKPIGYHHARDTRHASMAIGVIMNDELADLHADIRARKSKMGAK